MTDRDRVVVLLSNGAGWVEGRVIREVLNQGRWWWHKWSGPGFYQMMSELEDEGWVESSDQIKVIAGQTVGCRCYRRKVWAP